jgi:hypothetical protein
MAFVVTELDRGTGGAGTTQETGSFTWTVGKPVFIAIGANMTGANDVASLNVEKNAETWSFKKKGQQPNLRKFVGIHNPAGTHEGTASISVPSGGGWTGIEWSIIEIDGAQLPDPIAAVTGGENLDVVGQASGTAHSMALPRAPDAGNLVVVSHYTGTATKTEEAGWTEVSEDVAWAIYYDDPAIDQSFNSTLGTARTGVLSMAEFRITQESGQGYNDIYNDVYGFYAVTPSPPGVSNRFLMLGVR